MLIKKISLKNFRQYIDTTIEFSTDADKNVTIVMGDNGTGKTTLAQAFQWGLYGHTGFQIKELLNRKVREQMVKGASRTVSVSMDVEYNGLDYNIVRQVVYTKRLNERVEAEPQARFIITSVDENGVVNYMPDSEKPYFIKKLLPEDLSQFFFFDGEKIEEMAENIQSGKGEDFKEAVYSLVGLRGQQVAIEHLKAKTSSKQSVIKLLKAELEKNTRSINQLKEINRFIDKCDEEIEKATMTKEQVDRDIENINRSLEKVNEIIFSETPKIQIRQEYEVLEKKIQKKRAIRNEKIGTDLLKTFSKGFYGFVTTPIAKKEEIERILELSAPQDKIVPDLTQKMLLHLMEKGECLCGTSLTPGSLPYKSLETLLEYAYPKTIASLKEDYIKEAHAVEKEGADFYQIMKNRMRDIAELDAEIEALELEQNEKMDQLANTTKGEEAKRQKTALESQLKDKHNERDSAIATIANYTAQKDKKEKEKGTLIIQDRDSARWSRCLEYAEELHKRLKFEYEQEENKYRRKLENEMNRIFESIYEGNIKITIDPSYKIKANVNEEYSADDEVERNTAQSYALIFAFIAAIINLAKQKVNEDAFEDDELIDIEKEGYPMVMDAPLSAFDVKRIKSICTEIPQIADQVIMFIKDTDGNVAKEYMANKIGAMYTAVKVNDSNLESDVVREA